MSDQSDKSNQETNQINTEQVEKQSYQEQEKKLTVIRTYPHREAKLKPTIVHHPIYQCYYSY